MKTLFVIATTAPGSGENAVLPRALDHLELRHAARHRYKT